MSHYFWLWSGVNCGYSMVWQKISAYHIKFGKEPIDACKYYDKTMIDRYDRYWKTPFCCCI